MRWFKHCNLFARMWLTLCYNVINESLIDGNSYYKKLRKLFVENFNTVRSPRSLILKTRGFIWTMIMFHTICHVLFCYFYFTELLFLLRFLKIFLDQNLKRDISSVFKTFLHKIERHFRLILATIYEVVI